jgi:hypothetical protein
MPEPIPVFILSYNRPLYLWACLDSLHRYTQYPCKFIIADNSSPDPQTREVIRGFERRGMFHAVHYCEENSPARVPWMLDQHADLIGDFFCLVESDIQVFDTQPCWLGRMMDHMRENPLLAMLGSLVDTSDFVAPDAARALEPDMPEAQLADIIKSKSPERRIEKPASGNLITDFNNPPGRLILMRSSAVAKAPYTSDYHWSERLKGAGYETATAADVMHRHLSLLNLLDYPDYDTRHRNDYFRTMRTQTGVEK